LAIAHLDEFECIFGPIAVGRDDNSDRLADVAHPVDCDRPTMERSLDADHQTGGERGHLGPGQHRNDAVGRARGFTIDRLDLRVRVR